MVPECAEPTHSMAERPAGIGLATETATVSSSTRLHRLKNVIGLASHYQFKCDDVVLAIVNSLETITYYWINVYNGTGKQRNILHRQIN